MKVIIEYVEGEDCKVDKMSHQLFDTFGLTKRPNVQKIGGTSLMYLDEEVGSKSVVDYLVKNIKSSNTEEEVNVSFYVEDKRHSLEMKEVVEYIEDRLVEETFTKSFPRNVTLREDNIRIHIKDSTGIEGSVYDIEDEYHSLSMDYWFDYDGYVDSVFTKNTDGEITDIKRLRENNENNEEERSK